MAYDATAPADSGSGILTENAKVRTNWTELNTTIAVDHYEMDDASEGKHRQVTLPELGSSPTTAASEGAIYTKDSGTQPEAYFREESDGDEVQLTKNGTVNVESSDFCTRAYGTYTRAADAAVKAKNVTSITRSVSTLTVTLAVTMADTNYTIQVTSSAGDSFTISSITTSSFKIVFSSITTGSSVFVTVHGDL